MAQLKDLLVSGYSKLLNTLTTKNIEPDEAYERNIGTEEKPYGAVYGEYFSGQAESATYALQDITGRLLNLSNYVQREGDTLTGDVYPAYGYDVNLGKDLSGYRFNQVSSNKLRVSEIDGVDELIDIGSNGDTHGIRFFAYDSELDETDELMEIHGARGVTVKSSLVLESVKDTFGCALFNEGTSILRGSVKIGSGSNSDGTNRKLYVDGTTLLDGSTGIGGYNSGYKFYVNGSSYFNGNVGLGGYSSSYRLYVAGSGYFTTGIGIGAYDSKYKLYVNGYGRMQKVLIGSGTFNTSYDLEVSGDAYMGSDLIIGMGSWVIPELDFSAQLGSYYSQFKETYSRRIYSRYIDSSFSEAIDEESYDLYLGYGDDDYNRSTENIYFYSSKVIDNNDDVIFSRDLQATINSNGLKVDSHLGIAGINSGYNLYNAGSSYLTNQVMMPNGFKTGSRVSSTGSGVEVTADGGIEIFHSSTPFIDFHYASDTGDYTSRIIESAKGYLNVSGKFGIGGSNTSYNFYVNGTSYFTNNVGIGGYSSSYKLYVNGTTDLYGQTIVDKACTLSSGGSSIYVRSGSSSSAAGAGIEFYDNGYRRFRITNYRGNLYIQRDQYYTNTDTISGYKVPTNHYQFAVSSSAIHLGTTNPQSWAYSISFDAFGDESILYSNSKNTYSTFNGAGQGLISFYPLSIRNTYATAGDITSTITKKVEDLSGYFEFTQKSYDSSTYALNGMYESYMLPAVDPDLTEVFFYKIFTTKHKYESNGKHYLAGMSSSTQDDYLYYQPSTYIDDGKLYADFHGDLYSSGVSSLSDLASVMYENHYAPKAYFHREAYRIDRITSLPSSYSWYNFSKTLEDFGITLSNLPQILQITITNFSTEVTTGKTYGTDWGVYTTSYISTKTSSTDPNVSSASSSVALLNEGGIQAYLISVTSTKATYLWHDTSGAVHYLYVGEKVLDSTSNISTGFYVRRYRSFGIYSFVFNINVKGIFY